MANTKHPPVEEHLYPVTWDEVKDAELDDALRATPAQRLAWRLPSSWRGRRARVEMTEINAGRAPSLTIRYAASDCSTILRLAG